MKKHKIIEKAVLSQICGIYGLIFHKLYPRVSRNVGQTINLGGKLELIKRLADAVSGYLLLEECW